MSSESENGRSGSRSVLDEENFVDKKRKEMILSRRDLVDEREDELFAAAKMGRISMHEAASLWHDTVRRYLTCFEPLLRSEQIENSEEYYHNTPLGSVRLAPPQEFQADESRPKNGVFRHNGLVEADAPEPVEYPVRGLKTVIERDQYTHTWSFRVDMRRANSGPHSGKPIQVVQVSDTQPLGRGVLLNAIRAADEFLEGAGVGMNLGTPEVDVEAEPF